MSLSKPKTTPAFEDPDAGDTTVADAHVETATTADQDRPKTTALAAASSRAVGSPVGNSRVIDSLKNSIRVDYNTLAQVQAVQGAFIDKETEDSLGDTITVELLSWQDSFVCSPNSDDAEKELVKFSDDGITSKDGTDMLAHLAELKAQGFEKARISQRVVLVGALLAAQKDQTLVGSLIQLDLPPTGKTQFDRYNANCLWGIKTGKLTEDAAKTIKMDAKIAKGTGTIRYTVVNFSQG
jgi:hypothetical protein